MDRVVRVQSLTGVIVLCSWARGFTLTEPLSTQVINGNQRISYRSNPAKVSRGGEEELLVASCY